MSDPTAFIFSRYRELNGQFMVLFKALDELKHLQPGRAEFREYLGSLAGLLRFQFAYEDDLMTSSQYTRIIAHTKDHNHLRCFLGSLLSPPGEEEPAQLMLRQQGFVTALRQHCKVADNQLLAAVNQLHDNTTVCFRAKSKAIRRSDAPD